jgi:intracellular septation protein A
MTTTVLTQADKIQSAAQDQSMLAKFGPLVLDIGIPLASYYALREVFGMSLVMSLALSSVVPAIRSLSEFVRLRKLNALAVLMVAVNMAGIMTSVMIGDARLMMAKDSVISSVVGIGILMSVWRGKPMMTVGLKPFLTKGSAAKLAAWDELSVSSRRFSSLERRYSAIWGIALLADCAARVVGAYMLPVATMVWLSTLMVIGAIAIALFVAGGAAAEPMERLIEAAAE